MLSTPKPAKPDYPHVFLANVMWIPLKPNQAAQSTPAPGVPDSEGLPWLFRQWDVNAAVEAHTGKTC